MPRSCGPLMLIAKHGRLLAYGATALLAALAAGTGAARAGTDKYSLLTDITVPASTDVNCSSKSATLAKWDISWFDSTLDLFLLADRTNCAVDVFDPATNTFLMRVGGFQGAQASNDVSGPDGIVSVNGRYVFAGDGDSTVKVVDLFAQNVIATVNTGGAKRADEMALDPFDHLIIVANDADTPPFVTFISTTPGFGVLGQIKFPNATNGLEQSVYSSKTGLFYISVPEVNGQVGQGEIAIINPAKRKIVGHLPVSCEPAGLAIGPNLNAIVGCSDGPVQVINLAQPPGSKPLATFPTLAVADEVWFNKGSQQYFVAANGNTVKKGKKTLPAPVLGIIDAEKNTLVQLIPTTVGAHSVAADPQLNHIFLPNGATTSPSYPNCTGGCVSIFNVTGEAVATR